MNTLTICPACGRDTLSTQDVAIQEIDSILMEMRPPERLTELECRECHWFGSRLHAPL